MYHGNLSIIYKFVETVHKTMAPKRPIFTLTCRAGNDTISATMHFQEFVFKTPSNYPAETTTFVPPSRSGRADEDF